MAIAVSDIDGHVVDMTLRMPFHFGNVTATERSLLVLEVEADIDGDRQVGLASDTLLPKWFVKDRTYEEALEAMLAVIEAARRHAVELDAAETVFDYWWSLYRRQEAWAAETDHPPLLWNFGVSLVERGLVDAWCRHRGESFAHAVRTNSLGIDLGRIYDRLDGFDPATLLPDQPRRSLHVRHTVGHTDPLTDDDIPPGERLDDGLPQSLTGYIREDGISYFKIKLVGDVERDVERVRRVAETIEASSLETYAYTFDANEQYPDMEQVRAFWDRLRADPSLRAFSEELLAIEQPLPRDAAMTDETGDVLRAWQGPPVIIDESDGRVDSLGRALACGYAGTSHKNCKGVFKGVANACLVAHRNRVDEQSYVITAEDLMNVGPVALLQDLAVVATLGIEHVERNGHHYFEGLSFLPTEVQATVGAAHGDLYAERDDYWAVDIDGGRIDVGSVVDAPFGVAADVDLSRFTPLAAWRAE